MYNDVIACSQQRVLSFLQEFLSTPQHTHVPSVCHSFPVGCARSQKRSVGMSVRKLVIPGKKIHVDTRERERVLELKSFILQGLFSQNMSNNYALLSYCTDK